MQTLVLDSFNVQLQLYMILLKTLATHTMDPRTARDVRALVVHQIIHAVKIVDESRERAIEKLQYSADEKLNVLATAKNFITQTEQHHELPEEMRAPIAELVREVRKLQRKLPEMLSKEEEKMLTSIYDFHDEISSKLKEYQNAFENLKL